MPKMKASGKGFTNCRIMISLINNIFNSATGFHILMHLNYCLS